MKYSNLADIYENIESTSSSLDKTAILGDFLEKVPTKELPDIILLIEGRVFPEWDSQQIGIGARLILKAISSASGTSFSRVEKMWNKIGDLGEVAEKTLDGKKQQTLFGFKTLSTAKVLENLRKLAELEGSGTVDRKISLLKELFSNADPKSAKYILRTCLEDLRIGVGAGILRDSISKAFNVEKSSVQSAYDLTTDFSSVAELAKEKGDAGLKKVGISVGKPLKVMLYQKVADFEEGFKRVGSPSAFEYKFDGFRMQVHKSGSKIKIFTRRLEDVTKQFPDVVDAIKKGVLAQKCVIEGETIGIQAKTGKWLPFQDISQRIKRKYEIHRITKDVPVMLNLFDILYLEGKNLLEFPFKERRAMLKKIIKPVPNKLRVAEQLVTSDAKEAERFYKESLKKGNEGVMIKNLESPYKPGSRVGYGVKLKPIAESLDLVVVGAEWGTGKRAGWLSSFMLACVEPSKGAFLEIGKMGTGIKEKEEQGTSFKELTRLLKPLIISEKGKEVRVKPKIVLEVGYEEIQSSPTYGSGFALRFPKLLNLRNDRSADEADTLERVRVLFKKQKKR